MAYQSLVKSRVIPSNERRWIVRLYPFDRRIRDTSRFKREQKKKNLLDESLNERLVSFAARNLLICSRSVNDWSAWSRTVKSLLDKRQVSVAYEGYSDCWTNESATRSELVLLCVTIDCQWPLSVKTVERGEIKSREIESRDETEGWAWYRNFDVSMFFFFFFFFCPSKTAILSDEISTSRCILVRSACFF